MTRLRHAAPPILTLLTLSLCWLTPLDQGRNSSVLLAQSQPKRSDATQPKRDAASRNARERLRNRLDPTAARKKREEQRRAAKSSQRRAQRRTEGKDPRGDSKNKSAAADSEATKASTSRQGTKRHFQQLVEFIRRNSVWIVTILGAGIVAVMAWIFLGRSKNARGEPAFFELDDDEDAGGSEEKSSSKAKYSTTKIKVRDVADRLTGEVEETEVETDREYALVVDEEALKTAEFDDDAGQTTADSSTIHELLKAKDFDGAYAAYIASIERTGSAEFQSDMERKLGEHFLRRKQFDKAARVFEHHVATHPNEDITSETYFNLGYIHFFNRTFNKSRRFLKLYVESETDPAHVARAQRILQTIQGFGKSYS